jgi:hypothetical protein
VHYHPSNILYNKTFVTNYISNKKKERKDKSKTNSSIINDQRISPGNLDWRGLEQSGLTAWITPLRLHDLLITGEGFRAFHLLSIDSSHTPIDHRSNEMEHRLRFSFFLFTLVLLSSTAQSDLVISRVERWVHTFTFFSNPRSFLHIFFRLILYEFFFLIWWWWLSSWANVVTQNFRS